MKPSTPETLVPAVNALADVMTQTSENYQQLLHQPQAYAFCREAGRSLRCLSDRYAQVLLAAFNHTSDDYFDDEEVEGEDDEFSMAENLSEE